jgi:hypothetical protein
VPHGHSLPVHVHVTIKDELLPPGTSGAGSGRRSIWKENVPLDCTLRTSSSPNPETTVWPPAEMEEISRCDGAFGAPAYNDALPESIQMIAPLARLAGR